MEDLSLEDELLRAEDVILGSHGFSEGSKITSVIPHSKPGSLEIHSYTVTGVFPDGEVFKFESDGPLNTLELWALRTLGVRAGKELHSTALRTG